MIYYSTERPDKKYRRWRKFIMERDEKKCRMCGKTEKLEAHHILPYRYFPRYRFEKKNGIVLCKNCHKKIPRISAEIAQKVNVLMILREL